MDKKLKFSWGSGIFLLYTGFVAMIIFFVFRSTNEKVDLVTKDYYKQELKYQEKLDQIERANALEEKPVWIINNNEITFTFPDDMKSAQGEICFFKPSDKNLDVKIPLTLNPEGIQSVPVSQLAKGAYKVQLSWSEDELAYFTEGVIYIN